MYRRVCDEVLTHVVPFVDRRSFPPMRQAPLSESAVLAGMDRQLVRALQLEPRASFSRLAEALDVSEQTIARRYYRLRRDGLLRVVGAVDPRALGETDWMVRLRCRPDGAVPVAEALARRDDVSWVTINAGGSEVLFALRSRSEADREDLLVQRLPKSTPVLDIAAAVILHRYIGADAADWQGLRDTLTPVQVSRLTATPRVPVSRSAALEPGDHALLDLLARDGRTSYTVLARATGMTVGRVMRRVDALQASGVVYFDLDIAFAAMGPVTTAALWLKASPTRLEAVGRAIAEHDEVQFAAAITGDDNLVASVASDSLEGLYSYLITKIAAIDGINSYELSPVLRRVKQAGAITVGDRLAEPPPVSGVQRYRQTRT
ncbi:MAG: Lrp/AsnC family transcriptional regulator [Pseudonocardiales bacterium]|nr:Lrp/AsnC family transcriptional regulator [Pseudonocardiales bacterium]